MDLPKSVKSNFRWTRTSFVLLSGFLLLFFLVGYVWWPLLEDYLSYMSPDLPVWRQLDWLLIGNFLVMSLLILFNADLRRDIPYMLIGLAGGYIIETWGTLSGLWTYYTFETPPLWIIPAWPIATLSVYRLYSIARKFLEKIPEKVFTITYWPVFTAFYLLLLVFIRSAILHPLTLYALIVCFIIILTTKNKRAALLIFLLGSGLGYFLERWGTTRLCWAYYTGGTPPLFTVLAHGMASVAVWRVYQIFEWLVSRSGLKSKPWMVSDR
jgi:hypothetical protein